MPALLMVKNGRAGLVLGLFSTYVFFAFVLQIVPLHAPKALAVDTCNGLVATIVGTNGNDDIEGTSGDDVIVGLGGNDKIEGKGGNDTICGGEGNDNIDGDAGNDTLCGEAGQDTIDGGDGADTLCGGNGNDSLDGDGGADTLDGGAGNDTLDGGGGTDACYNDETNDDCESTPAGSLAICSNGTSSAASSAASSVASSAASSAVSSASSAAFSLMPPQCPLIVCVDAPPGCNIVGPFVDEDGCATCGVLQCASSASSISAGTVSSAAFSDGASSPTGGPDASSSSSVDSNAPMCKGKVATIYVLNGIIVGGDDDGDVYDGTLDGTSADDVIVGTAGIDEIDGGSGDDTVCGLGGDDDIEGESGDDLLCGNAGNDTIEGGSNNDTLCGDEDDDMLDGGSGDDELDGGSGTDDLNGDSGDDLCANGETNDEDCEAVSNDIICTDDENSSSSASTQSSTVSSIASSDPASSAPGSASSATSSVETSSQSSSVASSCTVIPTFPGDPNIPFIGMCGFFCSLNIPGPCDCSLECGASSSSSVTSSSASSVAQSSASSQESSAQTGCFTSADCSGGLVCQNSQCVTPQNENFGGFTIPEFSPGSGSRRGSQTNVIGAAVRFLSDRILGENDTAPGGFGGIAGPFTDTEIDLLCSSQKALPRFATRTVVEWTAQRLSDSMNRDIDMIVEALRDKELCEKAPTPVSIELPEFFHVDASGYPISSNPTWNACITGKVTLQDLRSNPDKDENGNSRDCSYYHTTGLWKHPDSHVYFEWNRADRTVKLPAGYVLIRNQAVTLK